MLSSGCASGSRVKSGARERTVEAARLQEARSDAKVCGRLSAAGRFGALLDVKKFDNFSQVRVKLYRYSLMVTGASTGVNHPESRTAL